MLTYDKDSQKWNESIIPDSTREKIVQDFISNTLPGSLPFLKGYKEGIEVSYKAAHTSGNLAETVQRLKTLEELSTFKDGTLQIATVDDGIPSKTDIQIENGKVVGIKRFSKDKIVYRLVNAYKEKFDFNDIPTPIGRPLEEVLKFPNTVLKT